MDQSNAETTWRPNPGMQELFLSCPADEVFYGGAAGGGKTESLLVDAIRQIGKGGYHGLLLRRTYPELEKSLILRSHEIFPKITRGKCRYDSINHRWLFPNHDIIEFGHCKTRQDVNKYQSAEYHYIGFDELTHFPHEVYLFLFSRLRSRRKEIKCYMRSASNPGGEGHNWVKKRFIDRLKPCRIGYFKRVKDQDIETDGTDTNSISRCWIPAGVKDNPKIDKSYETWLNQLPEILRKAFLLGDWNIFVGQYFKEFDFNLHVIQPFEIPGYWPRYRAIDWGYSDPTCCLWFAVAPDGQHFCYREYYKNNTAPKDVAITIRRMTGSRQVEATFGDPSMWNRQANGRSVFQDFVDEGLIMTKANNDRVQGWIKVHDMLALRSNGKPKLRIFITCENLIRTLPALQFSDKLGKKEDASQTQEDHAPDALRYHAISTLVEDGYPTITPKQAEENVHKLTPPGTEDMEMVWDNETGYIANG